MSSGLTKTKTIVGIDYSLNSPAICISTNGGTAFSDCYFYYLTSKKKHIGKMLENVIGYEHKEWKSPIERFTNLSGWVLHILDTLHKKQKNKHIFIEGYGIKITAFYGIDVVVDRIVIVRRPCHFSIGLDHKQYFLQIFCILHRKF